MVDRANLIFQRDERIKTTQRKMALYVRAQNIVEGLKSSIAAESANLTKATDRKALLVIFDDLTAARAALKKALVELERTKAEYEEAASRQQAPATQASFGIGGQSTYGQVSVESVLGPPR